MASRNLVRQWPAVHDQNKHKLLNETFKTLLIAASTFCSPLLIHSSEFVCDDVNLSGRRRTSIERTDSLSSSWLISQGSRPARIEESSCIEFVFGPTWFVNGNITVYPLRYILSDRQTVFLNIFVGILGALVFDTTLKDPQSY